MSSPNTLDMWLDRRFVARQDKGSRKQRIDKKSRGTRILRTDQPLFSLRQHTL